MRDDLQPPPPTRRPQVAFEPVIDEFVDVDPPRQPLQRVAQNRAILDPEMLRPQPLGETDTSHSIKEKLLPVEGELR